jgi:uncharacterized lipoprotein YbaY/uncharacterized membrane protein
MFLRPLAAAAALLVALAGCSNRVATDPATTAGAATTATAPSGDNVIRGRGTYLERIKIPPGADFTVQLVDNQLADTQRAVIASTTLENVAGPPYSFALPYDPAKLRPGGQYGLHASLRGVDGQLLFVTDTRVPVVPGDGRMIEFRMVRASAGDAPHPAPKINRTTWTCGGMTFEAAFDVTNERVDLALPGGAVSLPLAQSASGARYADHLGNTFWTKGGEATLTQAGGKKTTCVLASAPADANSPWAQAKARGMAFRGIGTEPGWMVEVGAGETPALHAELDYGGRKVEVARAQMLSGLLGYAGTSSTGAPVRLLLERKACSDGMSDEQYPVDARLEVGDKTYQGCGRFLTD